MEIIRGSLDDISRPASSDQTSSRASSLALPHSDRMGRITPFSLVVLTKDDADIESRSEGTTTASSARGPDKIQDPVKVGDERNEDSRLRRAMDEMRRLDEILSAKICTEKQVKRQRKELQAKLWQEFLQNKPEGHSEGAQETMNTRLFWALEASTGIEDEDDFVPLFETQVPDCDKKSDGWMESSEVRGGDAGGEQLEGSLCGASPSRKKQKDFVKRNIELVIGEGDQVVLTRGEKEHLAELLEGVDGGDEDGAGDADSQEDVWAVSVRTGQGYTPEPSDLQQLTDIDSKIRLLLPAGDLLSARSSYANRSMCQGRGSEAGWKCYGDLQPGETVLQDIKERRGQERRLHEIQQQLEMLNQGQEMTNGSADLTEEQLLSLLGGCELTEEPTQDLETIDTSQ
uniref:Fibrous sheath-interacting protein 1 n=1 Tax=Gasterosteus aculeatus aculeatus TaxID=481459 RepID=A0AAQ4QAE5_GASAC|nr:fibrous sheath-interacting protein 1 isoform X1 [Gasterosteus aculeatus aculeatus]